MEFLTVVYTINDPAAFEETRKSIIDSMSTPEGKPRKEVPLGCDYAVAIKKWSELEIDSKPIHSAIITFRYVAERYTREVIPTKAANTQRDNHKELIWLYKFFDTPLPRLKK